MTTYSYMVSTPVQAHEVVTGLYHGIVKPHTRTGAAGVITWETHNDWLRKKMRGAFHGYILAAFSEQVWFVDEKSGRPFRYAKEVWKEFLKQQFLEPQMETYTVRATGEVKVRKRRPSTEDLSDDEYQLFLTKVEAFAVVDLGIEFPEEGYPG